jgi:hypothetical protein
MLNVETFFLFIFILSILNIVRTLLNFLRSLLQTPPERYMVSSRELTFIGLSISYIITYFIKVIL